jgi:hypothetical protein
MRDARMTLLVGLGGCLAFPGFTELPLGEAVREGP